MPRSTTIHNAANPDADAGGREGPRPFNLHLFTTACMLTAAALPLAADPQHRRPVLDMVGRMTGEMMEGLKAYRAAPHAAQRRMYDILWQSGSSRLLRLPRRNDQNAAPVLLIPSLINRFDILDLDARHSFAGYLADRGFDVHILDWGAPGGPEKTFSLDDYIVHRLGPALDRLKNPHVIGYCMGGTMAAGAVAALMDETHIRSLTLLAAPWDFHAGDAGLPLRMNAFALSAGPVMEATNTLPVDWIQALFASVDPLFAFNKFRAFAQMDPRSEEARRFVLVEDWLNDGVDLTAPAARQALQQWYAENQPANGVWTIGRGLADITRLSMPVLAVAAGADRLVPAPSALAVAAHIDACRTLTPDIGHIGMMASLRAIDAVWAPVAAFLKGIP